MVIISYIIKHIITNKNKILHKLFYALFAPYNKKSEKKYRICFRIHTEFYIYHLRKYRMNLYKLNAQNKNTNLYIRFYIIFIRNQRKTTKKLITE